MKDKEERSKKKKKIQNRASKITYINKAELVIVKMAGVRMTIIVPLKWYKVTWGLTQVTFFT